MSLRALLAGSEQSPEPAPTFQERLRQQRVTRQMLELRRSLLRYKECGEIAVFLPTESDPEQQLSLPPSLFYVPSCI